MWILFFCSSNFKAIIFSCSKVRIFLIECFIANALYCMLIDKLMHQIHKLKLYSKDKILG